MIYIYIIFIFQENCLDIFYLNRMFAKLDSVNSYVNRPKKKIFVYENFSWIIYILPYEIWLFFHFYSWSLFFVTSIHKVWFCCHFSPKFNVVFIFSTENNVYHFDFQATLTECNIFRPKNEQQCWIFRTKVIIWSNFINEHGHKINFMDEP